MHLSFLLPDDVTIKKVNNKSPPPAPPAAKPTFFWKKQNKPWNWPLKKTRQQDWRH